MPRTLRSLHYNYCSCTSPRVPLASDFTRNYPFTPPLLLFSFSLHIPSFLPFISQINPIKSTSICRGINPKVTSHPGLRLLSKERSSLSCSLTSSKKSRIMIFPSTFLQTRLFDFLSLDQLSLPKSSPWAQSGNIITNGGS